MSRPNVFEEAVSQVVSLVRNYELDAPSRAPEMVTFYQARLLNDVGSVLQQARLETQMAASEVEMWRKWCQS